MIHHDYDSQEYGVAQVSADIEKDHAQHLVLCTVIHLINEILIRLLINVHIHAS